MIDEEILQQTFQNGFSAGMIEGRLKTTQDILDEIEKRINKLKEEKLLWESKLIKVEKGHFRNPNFGIQVEARVYELVELKKSLGAEK